MTVRLAMTYGSSDVKDLEGLLADDDLVLEQKFDGTRCLAVVRTTVSAEGEPNVFVQFLARNGKELKHTAAKQHFESIAKALGEIDELRNNIGETVLDGEIMIDTGQFILFDLPFRRVGMYERITPHHEYSARRQQLDVIAGDGRTVLVGRMTVGREEKAELLQQVMAGGGEGVMAKSLASPYNEGKRVKHSLKVKFTKTADVIVTSVVRPDPKHGTIAFHVFDEDGEQVAMGNCSAIGKPECKPGDVIEVKYLLRIDGGKLVQPSMLRVRTDREPESCGLDQFVTYSKAIV